MLFKKKFKALGFMSSLSKAKKLKLKHDKWIYASTIFTGTNIRLAYFPSKIDWASLIVTVCALCYFVLGDNFQVQAPGGLIFGGAISRSRMVFCVTSLGVYIWRGSVHRGGGGVFSEFYGVFFLTVISTFILVKVMLPVSMNSSHTSSCP